MKDAREGAKFVSSRDSACCNKQNLEREETTEISVKIVTLYSDALDVQSREEG